MKLHNVLEEEKEPWKVVVYGTETAPIAIGSQGDFCYRIFFLLHEAGQHYYHHVIDGELRNRETRCYINRGTRGPYKHLCLMTWREPLTTA